MMHEVTLKRTIVDNKGVDKEISEKYLVENKVFCAEAEATMLEYWNSECEVTSVRQSKIVEFVNTRENDEQEIYLSEVESIFVDEDGEEKSTKYVVGLFAKSVEEATNMMKEYMRQGIQDMRLVSVKRTKIADLL
jgi:hypothetical protein